MRQMLMKRMRSKRFDLDENATFAGILLGLLLGAVYAVLHIKQSGPARRQDLMQFGAATAELEMQASITEAKAKAKSRLERDD